MFISVTYSPCDNIVHLFYSFKESPAGHIHRPRGEIIYQWESIVIGLCLLSPRDKVLQAAESPLAVVMVKAFDSVVCSGFAFQFGRGAWELVIPDT